jgi:high-affinity Fe2+/Pb2+ permease
MRREPEKDLKIVAKESVETSRKLWVIAVLAFWVSAAISLLTLVVTGKLNLILTSITLGMLVLGVWLKIRYQLHQRKANSHQPGDDRF